jgi:hypothetical protein
MTTTQNPSTTGAGLTQSLLPDWNTDHGGFNFGDLLILLFDGILLIYTGWRSFDLLSGTVPAGWEVMAFIGLLALDIGAVIWSYIWIFNSTTPWQDRIAMIFFVIDMSGVALTSITDSLLYGDEESVMLAMIEPITMVVIPLIIISNVIAGIVYHFTSAETRARRTKRQLEAKAQDESQRQQDEELQLHYAQQSLLRRQAELPRKIALANLKIAQDQLEKDAMQALFGNGDVERGMGGNIGVNSPSANTGLADTQAQLLALQSMGVNTSETTGDAVADTAYPVYLKTNCPFSFAKIKTDGTGFEVVTHVVGLQFLHANPLSQKVRYIVENELTPKIPERDENGNQTPQGHRTLAYFSNINNKDFTGEKFLRIPDWNAPVAYLSDPPEAGVLSDPGNPGYFDDQNVWHPEDGTDPT